MVRAASNLQRNLTDEETKIRLYNTHIIEIIQLETINIERKLKNFSIFNTNKASNDL